MQKATNQVVLSLLGRDEKSDTRCHVLCEQLRQLPQFQQRGIGVFSEVALRQQAQAHELLVVGLEVGEVVAQ